MLIIQRDIILEKIQKQPKKRIKQLNDQNKRLQDEITDKKRENAELWKEINKQKVIKSLYNNALNQINNFDRRLKDKDEITKGLEVYKEQL